MKKRKIGFALLSAAALTAGVVWAADHIDAPAVAGGTSDITDYYAFESPNNSDNMVFVANVQGLIAPPATGDAEFDEQVMVEFNIDNTGDLVEDLVIQAIVENGEVKVYGPIVPSQTGITSIVEGSLMVSANVTAYGDGAIIGEDNAMKVFAGPRDDPFFFDFGRFGMVVDSALTAGATPIGFNNPGSDTFAGTNVMSIVIEVPKSSLGSSAALSTWVESKRAL